MIKLFMHYGRLRKKYVFCCLCTNLGWQECELKRKWIGIREIYGIVANDLLERLPFSKFLFCCLNVWVVNISYTYGINGRNPIHTRLSKRDNA